MPGAAVVVEVTGSEEAVRRLLELGSDLPRVATRAVNRTLSTIKTATVRAMARELGLRNKDVTGTIVIRPRASFANPTGALHVTGRRLSLTAWGARQAGAGVAYRLPGGRQVIPGGFLATMRSGHTGVFVRRQPSARRSRGAWGLNLPIVEQRGPSLPGAFVKAGIRDQMAALADQTLEKNLDHEIRFALAQRAPAGDE